MSRGTIPAALGAVAATGALLALAAGTQAQSATEIVDRALEHSDAHLEDVRTVRVIQRMEVAGGPGVVDTVHLEKVMEGGHAFLVPAEGDREVSPTRMVRQMAESAEYAGTETVDGHDTHVLVARDPEIRSWGGAAVDSMLEGSGSDVAVEVDEVRTYLDTESFVLRKSIVNLTLERNGETTEARHQQLHRDYETFNGMPYPRTRVMETTGLTAALSPEQMEQARKGMEEAREEMEELPEAQRAMAEKYMDQVQGMGSGTTKTVVEVLEVRVNGG